MSDDRPPAMGNEGQATGFPAGIERAITLAALDDAFREALCADRAAAVRSRGIELTPAEAQLLAAIPLPALERAIEQAVVPTSSRRGFIKSASRALAVLAGGGAILAGIPYFFWKSGGARPDREQDALRQLGSLGIRPEEWIPPDAAPAPRAARPPGDQRTRGIRPDHPPEGRPPGEYWIRLAGYTALLYVPAAPASAAMPLLLAFHDGGKTVLDAVRAWRDNAMKRHHLLVAVKWGGRAGDVEGTAGAAGAMLDDLAADYDLSLGRPLVVAGAGLGATIALEAALFVEKRFTAVVAVDGALRDGWESRKLVDPKGTAVWAAVGPENAAAKRLDAQMPALERRGVRTRLVKTIGASASELGAAQPAWEWIESLAPQGAGRPLPRKAD